MQQERGHTGCESWDTGEMTRKTLLFHLGAPPTATRGSRGVKFRPLPLVGGRTGSLAIIKSLDTNDV